VLNFYLCPVVMHRQPWGTTSPVGKVYVHRAAHERYTLHRGLGELVLCSLGDPLIETQANIAADQECVEWPDRDALWTTQVGDTRRRIISEILSAHGVPLAWVDVGTTAGDVLNLAIQVGLARQRGKFPAVARRALAPSAEMELYREIHDQRVPLLIQGVRL
jgi:hypothetical protein